ncbi:hypothetical protein Avbf_14961 [Armadillidium vulgare]|nr:hypothetical protein Avbf_14961 [Armadillidium vulgare]
MDSITVNRKSISELFLNFQNESKTREFKIIREVIKAYSISELELPDDSLEESTKLGSASVSSESKSLKLFSSSLFEEMVLLVGFLFGSLQSVPTEV